MVYMPLRVLLEVISLTAKLQIRGYGHRNRSHGTTETCVMIDLPCLPGDFEKKQAIFTGQLAVTLDVAEENHAQAAFEHICTTTTSSSMITTIMHLKPQR